MSHPIDAVIIDGLQVDKEVFRTYMESRIPLGLVNSTEIQSMTLPNTSEVLLGGNHYIYDSTDTSSAHNGFNILVDGTPGTGRRYRITGPRIYAGQYGVKTDGTDSTVAMQRCVDAAITFKLPIELPIGFISISGQINVSSPIMLMGMGREASVFVLTSTTQNGFNISANDTGRLVFQGFGITSFGTQTAGSGIVVDSSGSHLNYESRFVDLRFSNLFHAIDFERAAYWILDGCAFEDMKDIFIIIKNVPTPDAGDSYIVNCLFEYFQTITSANVMIFWESSGGLKVIGNKFNGGFRSMFFDLVSGGGTGSMVVACNSIEGFTDTGILIAPQTGSPVLGTIRKFGIVGNEFGGFNNGVAIKVTAASTPTWFKGLTITGNTIATGINGAGTTGRGIDLDFCQEICISGNTVRNEGPTGTTVGINLGSNCSVVSKGINVIAGFNTALSDSSTSPQPETIKGAITAGSTIDAASTISTQDTFRARSVSPGFWLDETDSITKGAFAVLDGGVWQVQRRATNFGAFEATIMSMDITSGLTNHVGAIRVAPVAFASLIAAATAGAGARAWVNNCSLAYTGTNIGSAANGSGANLVPVYSTGSAWLIG